VSESAPLIGTEAAPVPPGATAEWFSGAGGARLRAALFSPPAAPLGSVVISPGRTEPIEKFFETALDLTSRGFAVLVHDWRGQGLSHRDLPDRLLGHARGWRPYMVDFDALLNAFAARLPQPWIALGHSMGGCLTLLALAEGERRFAGAILSSPMLGLVTAPVPRPLTRVIARAHCALGQAAAPVWRPKGAETAFADNILTHDAARYARNEGQVAACPDLAVDRPTWGWLDFAFQATDRLATGPGVPGIAIPVSILAAGEEKIVDNAATRTTAARIPNVTLQDVPGAYHELLQETDDIRAAFWSAFEDLAEKAGIVIRPARRP